MLKKLLIASLLATVGASCSAANYFLVVPVPGKTVNASAIEIALAAASLPNADVGAGYSYDFNKVLSVTGDPQYTGYGMVWAVVQGTLPAGLTLDSKTGALSGTATAAGDASFTVQATYKTKSGQQAYQLTAAQPVPLITIQDATFGYNVAVNGNITSQVSAACNGKVSCSFNPSSMIADPYPGVQKGLLVHYSCNSNTKTYQYGGPPEAGPVTHTLSCP